MPGTAPAATVPLTRPAEEVMHTPSHQPATSRQSAKPAATSSRKVTEHKSFGNADEIREFTNGRAEIVKISGGEVGRYVFSPGWHWSRDVKPIAMTQSCEVPHFNYHISGTLAVRMDDGTEFLAGPGDITSLPSGHDAWVVGNEPVVIVDFHGASDYAKKS